MKTTASVAVSTTNGRYLEQREAEKPVRRRSEERTLKPETESEHASDAQLDQLSGAELARLMSLANREAVAAVDAKTEVIGALIEELADRFASGGRLLLVGAGTSGRLAVLEAAECPPTFHSPPSQVRAIIAGGGAAMTRAIEGAEDDAAAGARAVEDEEARPGDLVIGLSASGGAPFVHGAIRQAQLLGAGVAFITSNPAGSGSGARDVVLETGPELLTGSTRLKAATAAKCALNAITTGAMALSGRVHGQWMVEVRPTNKKLTRRAQGIIVRLGGCQPARAAQLLDDSDGDVKLAIVRARLGLDRAAASVRLAKADRRLREVLT